MVHVTAQQRSLRLRRVGDSAAEPLVVGLGTIECPQSASHALMSLTDGQCNTYAQTDVSPLAVTIHATLSSGFLAFPFVRSMMNDTVRLRFPLRDGAILDGVFLCTAVDLDPARMSITLLGNRFATGCVAWELEVGDWKPTDAPLPEFAERRIKAARQPVLPAPLRAQRMITFPEDE